jgi:hypothetical protein
MSLIHVLSIAAVSQVDWNVDAVGYAYFSGWRVRT